MLRTAWIALLIALVSPAAHATGSIFIGTVRDSSADCESPGVASEFYSIKFTDTGEHWDWQAHLYAKDGGGVGMLLADYEFESSGTYQVLPGNHTLPEGPTQVMAAFVTFSDGRLYIESETMMSGFLFAGAARAQVVGDTPPRSLSAAPVAVELVLPDDTGSWAAGLETGVAEFPRLVEGWPELAFAALRELDWLMDGPCATGGLYPDPDGSGRLLAGYNVYRLATDGERPSREDVGRPGNWVDFIPMPPHSASQARLHDPDGFLDTGDEVITWQDAPLARDGGLRRHGSPPSPGEERTSWYVVQPVARGDVSEFASVSIAGGVVSDHRADLDGDGLFDAVELNEPVGADGPEFISPQAEDGGWGLGLTAAGRPLVSKLMAVTLVPPADDPRHLPIEPRLSGDLLVWGYGPSEVDGWRVNRSLEPAALTRGAHAWNVTPATATGRTHADTRTPGDGRVYY